MNVGHNKQLCTGRTRTSVGYFEAPGLSLCANDITHCRKGACQQDFADAASDAVARLFTELMASRDGNLFSITGRMDCGISLAGGTTYLMLYYNSTFIFLRKII